MSALTSSLARVADIRSDESGVFARAAAAFFLLIAAHAARETGRDALLLSELPARDLGLVYLAGAASILPVAATVARVSPRFGARRTLVVGLAIAVLAVLGLFHGRVGWTTIVGTYVGSSLMAACSFLCSGLSSSPFSLSRRGRGSSGRSPRQEPWAALRDPRSPQLRFVRFPSRRNGISRSRRRVACNAGPSTTRRPARWRIPPLLGPRRPAVGARRSESTA